MGKRCLLAFWESGLSRDGPITDAVFYVASFLFIFWVLLICVCHTWALYLQGTDTAQEWERNRRKTLLEYLPKLVIVGLIWIVTILLYM